jgi:hypothetical protein
MTDQTNLTDDLWRIAELTRSYMVEIARAPHNRDQTRIDKITAELVPAVIALPWEQHLTDLAKSTHPA